ncbi:MAG: tRNA (guanosine(37)-N1)-methyltransferase TrmD [Clostridia bacterium]|nr:tRNA (guanosine(37)-N1)-methyltransferase TrmD [Clostridia bacterium]
MKIEILTLFPEMFSPLFSGILGDAVEKGILEIHITNIRDYSLDKHKHVDDYPFGGGAGMVMAVEPIARAIEAVDPNHEYLRIFMSPRGKTFCQTDAEELSGVEKLLFLCGSYEGVDQRAIDMFIDREISIGDYVLTSGELAVQVVVNATSRYVEGVLGSMESLKEESFTSNLLEYPQYTRPQTFRGVSVPDVLVSGNHAEIDKWRRAQSLKITKEKRPDLLEKK